MTPAGAGPPRFAPGVSWLVAAGAGTAGAAFSRTPLFGLEVAIGAAFVLLTSVRTKALTYFFVLPLVGWAKIHFPTTSVQGAPEIIAFATLAHIGWEFLADRLQLPLRHITFVMIGMFAAIVVVQARNPIIAAAGGGVSGARVYLAPLVLFVVGVRTLRRPEDARAFLKVIIVTAIIAGLYTLKQVFGGFDHAERTYYALRPGTLVLEEKKIFSTSLAPDTFGFVAASFVLFGLTARAQRIWPRAATVAIGLSAIGVIASGVRVAVLGVGLAATLLLAMHLAEPRFQRQARRGLFIAVVAATVLVLLVAVTPARERGQTQLAPNPAEAAIQKLALLKKGSADEDYSGRARRVRQFVPYILRHPWGTGPGVGKLFDYNTALGIGGRPTPKLPAYVLSTPFVFQHDFYYFDVGIELGLIALVLYLSLLARGVGSALSMFVGAAGDPDRRALAALSAAIVVLAAVDNLTNEAFRTPQVAAYVWFAFAIPVTLATRRLRPAEPVAGAAIG